MRTLSKISFTPKLTLVFSTALRRRNLRVLRVPSIKASSARSSVGPCRSSQPNERLQISSPLSTRGALPGSMHRHVTANAHCSSLSVQGSGSFANPARLRSTGSQGRQSVLRHHQTAASVAEDQYGPRAKGGGISPLASVPFLWQCRSIAIHVKAAV